MMLVVSVAVGLLALVGAQNLSAPNDGFSESPIVPGHNAFPLRILPLGASITWGQGSSDGNGYREHLRTLLLQRNTVVDMVGTVKSGFMADSVSFQAYTVAIWMSEKMTTIGKRRASRCKS